MNIVNTTETAPGVYFRRSDYASLWLRLLIDVIDVFVVSAVCLAVGLLVGLAFPFSKMMFNLVLAIWVAIAFCYFVVLKGSKKSTVGYRLGDVRIVGLDGRPVKYSTLTFRLLFAPLGPLNWLLDLLWLSGDPHRQSIRDKLGQTYVVKKKAEPAGTGRIVHRYYDICGYNFLFREVEVGTDPKRVKATSPKPN